MFWSCGWRGLGDWRCGRGRGRRLNTSGFQSAINDDPYLFCGERAVDVFAVDEDGRCAVDAKRVGLMHRLADGGFVLFGEAGIEFGRVERKGLSLVVGDAVQRGKAFLGVVIGAADFVAVRVEVIHVAPIGFVILRGDAVGVNGGVHGPGMNFDEWIVLVNETHRVLVAIHGARKEFAMHGGAEGTLEIIKADNSDLGVGIAADGATIDGDVLRGNVVEIEGLEAREGFVVGGDEEVGRGGASGVCERDAQRVITGELAGRALAERDGVIAGDIELGADHDLNVAREGGVLNGRVLGCRVLGFAADGRDRDDDCGIEGETKRELTQIGPPLP
uniref:Uncharacterized protein n=1 Tax=mine drainage metagenome TaxID=410659 RepID=E6Q070_9ZZZZ